MDTTNKIFTKVTVSIFVIGIVVGFGAASLWARRAKNMSDSVAVGRQESATPSSETTEKTGDTYLAQISASASATDGKNSLAVDNQPAGTAVTVSSVMLEKNGWVAIHEEQNGTPGKILGAQLFLAGTSSGKVDLLRGTVANGTYDAMLHADDGDHKFDPAKDLPLKNAAGMPIMVKFTARAPASIQ